MTDNDVDVYVPRDPPGEREEDVKREEALGHSGYGVKIQSEQQHRLDCIIKVAPATPPSPQACRLDSSSAPSLRAEFWEICLVDGTE